jgi:hypothetical protein
MAEGEKVKAGGSARTRSRFARPRASRHLLVVLGLLFALSTGVSDGYTPAAYHTRAAVPTTTIQTRLAGVTRTATATFRFGSTVAGSKFQCSLDGGPWRACSSPRTYAGLANGHHKFEVRAISPSGTLETRAARASWFVDTIPVVITLTGVRNQGTRLVFSGAAGSGRRYSRTVRVEVFDGPSAKALPVRTITATAAGGRWSAAPSAPLQAGTYTAVATQPDTAAITGASAPRSFAIDQAAAGTPAPGVAARAQATTTYSIGGTVSGLSGKVILRDNGGDDLSVSANGSFTFKTHLASGAAYAVTVETNPTGQACTVANGSGTVASANVTNVAVTCAASSASPASASDNFNRANGGLGTSWAAITDGGLSISAQQVVGNAGAVAGDIRVGEVYGSDQYSQVTVTSTQLSGGQWMGPSVRIQNGGQNLYLGIYFWNNGNPVLQLYKRTAGTFAQLGSSVSTGALPAGTLLTLSAVGSTIALQENGVTEISVTDSTLTGGSPGLLTFDTATADNWAAGYPGQYSIGGTVSGLVGTVGLHDNGGDALNVISNGSFTFKTALTTGSRYDATIATNPAGQVCTVAGGAGTVQAANVSSAAVTCTTLPTTPAYASDNFNRANGGLGSGWAAASDGGLSIAVRQVVGNTGAVAGAIRAGEVYGSDQNSQVTVTSAQLSGGQWMGPSVRNQNGGLDNYVGIYIWNGGTPQLRLYRRMAGTFTQLGSSYNSGALPLGTVLTLSAVGSSITLAENGVTEISVTDSSLAGGAPGLMTYDTATADNWTGWTQGASPPPTYSIGGTVSGLSGTVVLRDNGGDDLSLSSNGSYNFKTQMPSGGTYAVTVETNPSGQACTVANGSGTVASANVTNVAVTCAAPSATPAWATDPFNRANGDPGPAWAATTDGGLSISSQQLLGNSGTEAGEIRVGEVYGSDQNSQVTLTATQLSSGQWVGPSVRNQNGGQNLYLAIYFWNSGNPQLQLYKRTSGTFTELGSSITTAPLPAGTVLTLTAVGTTITFQENGQTVISVTDSTLTGGSPGLMTYDTATAANWTGWTQGGVPPTYSVGGTVSGLSGTLALRDDGTDVLNVSSNGAFTFGSQVAEGSAYNVAVASEPSGQVCTVANGSGTVGSANVTNVTVTCAASSLPSPPASDSFARANGGLGSAWTAMNDGGLSISSQQAVGTSGAVAGDIRVGEVYGSDQYSEVTLTSTQLSGGQWVGPSVRSQNGGQDTYLAIYFWNTGNPLLQLYKRTAGAFTQLGGSYSPGPLAAGTELTLSAVGSTITLQENGMTEISVTDGSLTGGSPGMMSYGTAAIGAWSGGNGSTSASTPMTAQFSSTDANGIQSYNYTSTDDGGGTHVLRVLRPTSPAPGVPHNFLFVLPVEPEEGSTYGDGINTLMTLNAQNQYNVTIVEPAFSIDPWYADSPNNLSLHYETFMANDLVPWVEQNLAISGTEQNWLIGFSKSGLGGQDLILKHPNVFTVAATWDFPADMGSYTQFGSSSENQYGTEANYQANYRLTQSFVDARKGPFLAKNRIWIGGYEAFKQDMTDYDTLLTNEGIQHSTETPTQMPHRWDGGWVPLAMAALGQDAGQLPAGP